MPGPEQFSGLDKLAHLTAFGVPAGLAWLLGARWLIPLMVLHALISEPLQGWLSPLRSPDPLDALADLVGIALGVGAAVWVTRTVRTRRAARRSMMES